MLTPYHTSIGSFTRKSTFFWAAVGATVGLSNLWQFPYLASLHGGAAFLVVYLVCLLVITLPLMVAESGLGRQSRHGLVLALDGLIRRAGCSRGWMYVGRLAIVAAFLVLSYSAVFGAIAVAYVFQGAIGRLSGVDEAGAGRVLAALVADPGNYRVFVAWHAFFLFLVVGVSMQGVVKGLERAVRTLVPGLLLLLLALFALAAVRGHLSESVGRLLGWRLEDLDWTGVRAALFQAVFTLGLGMGVWTILGAYSTAHTRFKRSLIAVVLVDALVAVLAGLMMYAMAPADPTYGGRGFELLFITLPVSLGQFPYSQFLMAVTFLMVVLVVWTSSLALMEPVVGWFREWTGAPRGLSALLVGVLAWVAGLASLLSFNLWSDYRWAGATAFRWLEFVTAGIIIPLVASLLAFFIGRRLYRHMAIELTGETPAPVARIWYYLLRTVLPLLVAVVGVLYLEYAMSGLCTAGGSSPWCEQRQPAVAQVRENAPNGGDFLYHRG
ncbi:sodium-dependent transporter [Marinobacter sp. C2H3]|uniref:sodium-dependent transporter n=1 Tax=Marinobacter sp. C2H3 TaxID=3119003 RepID=UPI00300F7560